MNTIINQRFLGVVTDDPDKAVTKYIKKTGFEPTILLIRPEFIMLKDHPLLVRSRYAAWGMILVSHLLGRSEINPETEPVEIYREVTEGVKVNMRTIDFSIPCAKVGRPEHTSEICPHCHAVITDFNNLGFWYGWSLGITPPYWEDLRLFVFKRDNYVCQGCKKKFPPILLQAHHINKKENGGEDGARNLTTLCSDCHQENKPIFEDAT